MTAKISWLEVRITGLWAAVNNGCFTRRTVRVRANELICIYGINRAKAEALIRCIEAWRRHDRTEALLWDHVAQHLGQSRTDEVRQ